MTHFVITELITKCIFCPIEWSAYNVGKIASTEIKKSEGMDEKELLKGKEKARNILEKNNVKFSCSDK